VPDDVRAYFAERAELKRDDRSERDETFADWQTKQPVAFAAWKSARRREVPSDLLERMLEGREDKADATRNHGAAMLERYAEGAPYLLGGSADLAGSNAPPFLKGLGAIGQVEEGDSAADFYAGTNIHFGVREHAMGAISNGIALDGTLRPFCGTFLIFSDYLRPAIRLAALMKTPSFFIFTHDSIYLGEDGPTHQPIEQLDALRAIPELPVFRPADGVETAVIYDWIARKVEGPALVALTRQKLPPLTRPAGFEPTDVLRGAYVVRDPEEPKVVLVATGSEVSLACDAAEKLAAERIQARVVSLPCYELFMTQPKQWRDALVPPDGPPVIVVEAGPGHSLRGLAGPRGSVYGIDRFGASAPYADLAEFFGFTPDRLTASVIQHLRSMEVV